MELVIGFQQYLVLVFLREAKVKEPEVETKGQSQRVMDVCWAAYRSVIGYNLNSQGVGEDTNPATSEPLYISLLNSAQSSWVKDSENAKICCTGTNFAWVKSLQIDRRRAGKEISAEITEV